MQKLTAINIYPIKSLGGISLDSSIALKEGLEYDRRWMLVDTSGKFLTQRENAAMTLFKTSLSENTLKVTYQNDVLDIPLNLHEGDPLDVNVWDSDLKAQQVNKDINDWFSDHLKINCKLVKMTNISKRKKLFKKPPFTTDVSFADGYPCLILSEESMQFLNDKLDVSLDINRFRANLIVSGCTPHEEDEWNDFDLGKAQMRVVKPCARCVVTTINQETGEKGVEPLKALSTYRKKLNKIYFGANVIIRKEGMVNVGDTIKL